jgi:hypothetical protein
MHVEALCSYKSNYSFRDMSIFCLEKTSLVWQTLSVKNNKKMVLGASFVLLQRSADVLSTPEHHYIVAETL